MLSSKWHTLNHNCQKFNAVYNRCTRLGKSEENEMDVMKRAKATYRDENKSIPFVQEDAWEILRSHSKWDAPEPVDLTEGDVPGVGNEDLFGKDVRPRPSGPDKSKRPAKKPNPIPRRAPGERNNDMLSSKWHTLNHNCQKFNAVYNRCTRLGKSEENEMDVMKRAKATYRDENKSIPFVQEDAWEILRSHSKWDAPEPVDLTEGDVPGVGNEDLFGKDVRPRPSGPDKSKRPAKKPNPIPRRAPGELVRIEFVVVLVVGKVADYVVNFGSHCLIVVVVVVVVEIVEIDVFARGSKEGTRN
nr:endopeptidase, NLPC/P60 domain, LRAT-like domain protein [Tanacetum cinerariifolium]